MTENEISERVIGCAIQVHRELGPGLLESAYEVCLHYELNKIGMKVVRQKALPLYYKEVKMDVGYRLDLIIENKVIVEVKSCDFLHGIHAAQVLTYLKLTGCKLGLIINFNVELLKQGIKRIVHQM